MVLACDIRPLVMKIHSESTLVAFWFFFFIINSARGEGWVSMKVGKLQQSQAVAANEEVE